MFPPNQDQFTILQSKITDLEQQLYQCQMELQRVQENQYGAEPILHEVLEQVLSDFTQKRQEEYVEREFRIIRPDGEIRWLFSRSSPIFDEVGPHGVTEELESRLDQTHRPQAQSKKAAFLRLELH